MTSWRELNSLLDELRSADPSFRVPGAVAHRYTLGRPMTAQQLHTLESSLSVELPSDYAEYLVEFANGGAGPSHGVWPAGFCQVDGSDVPYLDVPWVGDIRGTFRFSDAWNLPPDDGAATDELRARALREIGISVPAPSGRVVGRNVFRGGEPVIETLGYVVGTLYFSPRLLDGAIPLCDDGCGLSTWLVVSGQERGHVWQDLRADQDGVRPASTSGERRLTFRRWYEQWLIASLALARGEA